MSILFHLSVASQRGNGEANNHEGTNRDNDGKIYRI